MRKTDASGAVPGRGVIGRWSAGPRKRCRITSVTNNVAVPGLRRHPRTLDAVLGFLGRLTDRTARFPVPPLPARRSVGASEAGCYSAW